MASLEKQITDAFELLFTTAREKGSAQDFLKSEGRSGAELDMAVVMTEYVLLHRQGRNPYRADIADQMRDAKFFEGVSDGELEATRLMLGLLQAMRKEVSKQAATANLAAALKIANQVEKPAVVGVEAVDGKAESKKPGDGADEKEASE